MFYKILNRIKINNEIKKKKLIININKNELFFLKKLIKLNIIKFVFKYKNKYILILNFFNKKKLIFNLKIIYKPSQMKNIKLKNLKKINKYNKIILITTNKGLLDNFEAYKANTGGVIINYLWN